MNTIAAITAVALAAPLLVGGVATVLTPLLRRRRVSAPNDTAIHTIYTDGSTDTAPSANTNHPKAPITGLLIHSVDETPRLNLTGISKNTFKEILGYLKNNNINTITVSQQPAPTATTAITFDDGLCSFFNNAYPLLEERGVKSTIFPVAGLIGKRGDWDVIGKTRHMTAAMLREVAGSGHEIGSHSLTHANLVWLNDRELIEELRESKLILEDITGTAVRSLSFPFGSWNTRVWNAAKSVGYECATAYRGHRRAPPEFLPVFGVYRFDSAIDAVVRAVDAVALPQNATAPQTSMTTASTTTSPSTTLIQARLLQTLSRVTSRAFASLMSHFCKGTPLVKFRKTYRLFPQAAPPSRTCAERS